MLTRHQEPDGFLFGEEGNDDRTVESFARLRIDDTAQFPPLGAQRPASPTPVRKPTDIGTTNGSKEADEWPFYCDMMTYRQRQESFHRQTNDGHSIGTDLVDRTAFGVSRLDYMAHSKSFEAQHLVAIQENCPASTTDGPRRMEDKLVERTYGSTLNARHDQQRLLHRQGNGDRKIDQDHTIPSFGASRAHQVTPATTQNPSSSIQALNTNTTCSQWKIDETESDGEILESSKAIGDAEENPSPQPTSQSTVVLLGKLGHGKTRIVNLICGESFDSNMGIGSCTRSMQIGESLRFGISIIDTPGFYSCRDTSEHISQQKSALEGELLNGIYAVVKFGRIDEMVEILGQVMDFCGDDDIRILITHMDVAASEPDFDLKETRDLLSESLDVPIDNIGFVGKGDLKFSNDEVLATSENLENFVRSTMHEPRSFEVSTEQSAYMSARSPGARQFDCQLSDTYKTIDAALGICETVSGLSDNNISPYYLNQVKTAAILAVQDCVKNAASDVRASIHRQSAGLAASELNVVHANVNVKLKLGVDRFLSKSDNLAPALFHSGYSDSYNYSGQRSPNIFGERLTAQFQFDGTQSICWVMKQRDGKNQTMTLEGLPQLAAELQLERSSKRGRKRDGKKSRRSAYCNQQWVSKSTSITAAYCDHESKLHSHSQVQRQSHPAEEKTPCKKHSVEMASGDCQDVKGSRSLVVSGQEESHSLNSCLRKSDGVSTVTSAQPKSGNDEEPSAHKSLEGRDCDETNNGWSASESAHLLSAPLKDWDSKSCSSPIDSSDVGTKKSAPHSMYEHQDDSSEAVEPQTTEGKYTSAISQGDGNPNKHILEQDDDSIVVPKRRRMDGDQSLSQYLWMLICCPLC